jgi:hypothetical protein
MDQYDPVKGYVKEPVGLGHKAKKEDWICYTNNTFLLFDKG